MQRFSQIRAWQRAHALSVELHQVAAGFGAKGHANLRSQLTRACDSIGANIVEGCGKGTAAEFARFLSIAIGSANEVENHLFLARDLGLLSQEQWKGLADELIEIRKMTFGYRKRVLASGDGPRR